MKPWINMNRVGDRCTRTVTRAAMGGVARERLSEGGTLSKRCE